MNTDYGLLFAGIVVGGALAILLWKIVPYFLHAWGITTPKRMKMDEWQDEVIRGASVMFQDMLQAARSQAYFASLVGQVPDDFDPALWRGMSIAHAAEQEILRIAEREGLVQPELMSRLFDRESRGDVVQYIEDFQPPKAYEEEKPTNVRRLPSGRMAPRRAIR